MSLAFLESLLTIVVKYDFCLRQSLSLKDNLIYPRLLMYTLKTLSFLISPIALRGISNIYLIIDWIH